MVRGDLQQNIEEDKRSPTTSYIFIPCSTPQVHLLDFIVAFLQAKVCGQFFVKLPAIYGKLFLEFKAYLVTPFYSH